MKIEVPPKTLTTLFTDFVKGSKLLFNFWCDGYRLKIQLLGEYTIDSTIPIMLVEGTQEVIDTSVFITSAIKVLEDDKSFFIEFTNDGLNIEQGLFRYTMLREFESRKDLSIPDDMEFKNIKVGRLKYLTSVATSLGVIAKELKIYPNDPVFQNGICYVNYDNISFSDTMEFEDCSIPLEVLKQIVYRLSDNAMYTYYEEKQQFIFKSEGYTFWIPTVTYNARGDIVQAIEKKKQELKAVTKISMKEFINRLEVISNNFPKQIVKFCVGDFKFNASIINNDMYLIIGDGFNKVNLTINVTTGVLSVILKLFKEEESIEVLRGGNCICLRCQTKTLLIAGLIY